MASHTGDAHHAPAELTGEHPDLGHAWVNHSPLVRSV